MIKETIEKSEVIEMPRFWPEILETLQVNENILFTEDDNINTAGMAAVRLKKRTGKVFKIRTNKKTNEVRIWRTK